MGPDDSNNFNAAVSVNSVTSESGGVYSPVNTHDAGAQTKRAHIKSLIAKAARDNGVSYEDIMSRARPQNVCRARFDAIAAVAAAYPDMSFPRLGRIFQRDHSSIVHALMMRGHQPRSGRIQEYKKFAALMQRRVGALPTEGETDNA